MLILISIQLAVIGVLLLGIYARLVLMKQEKPEWLNAPVNMYGENMFDAIQNAHARGLRGIDTNER